MKVKVEYKGSRKTKTIETAHGDQWKNGKIDPKLKATQMLAKHGKTVALETAWQHYQLQDKGTLPFQFWREVVAYMSGDYKHERKPHSKAERRKLRLAKQTSGNGGGGSQGDLSGSS